MCICMCSNVLLMRCPERNIWKHFCKQSLHLYTGTLDFHSSRIQGKWSAPLKDERSHIVFFSSYIPPLFKLSFRWWGWVSTAVPLSKPHFFPGEGELGPHKGQGDVNPECDGKGPPSPWRGMCPGPSSTRGVFSELRPCGKDSGGALCSPSFCKGWEQVRTGTVEQKPDGELGMRRRDWQSHLWWFNLSNISVRVWLLFHLQENENWE